jgi:Rha family phage regulatory protein
MHNIISQDQFGITEKNGIPVVSSKYVSENFSKNHQHVLRDIEKALIHFNEIDQSRFGQINFIKSSYKDSQNRKQPEYLLTRDGFSYIAMGFTGKKAAQFKIAYINAFNQMESFIKNLLDAKLDFPEFTDAIMQAHEEPKHYHFSNECDMINSIVLGMSAKKFKETLGIEAKSIRPYLSAQQIRMVKALQRIDIGLIYSIPDYQQRKQVLEQQYMRLQQKAISA